MPQLGFQVCTATPGSTLGHLHLLLSVEMFLRLCFAYLWTQCSPQQMQGRVTGLRAAWGVGPEFKALQQWEHLA